MTGFARGSVTTGALTVTVECRSVNNRYLDLQCRMPDTLRGVEGSLRDQAGTFFARGKLEMLVRVSDCLLYTSPSPRDKRQSRMPSSA